MRRTQILLCVLSAPLVMLVAIAIRNRETHEKALNRLKTAITAYAAKVGKTVENIQVETTSESVSNLYFVGDYFSTGPSASYVTDENQNQVELDAIMSNRRFRKAFSELGQIDKATASQLVKANLLLALAKYSSIYEDYMRVQTPLFKIATNGEVPTIPVFPAIEMGFIKPEDQGRETLMGEKMKLLSLVWISGMLELTDNREQVEEVVRLARKQKNDLDNDQTLQPAFKQTMLGTAILYNRQILGSGLIGVAYKDAAVASDAMKTVGIHWQQRKLVAYDAALTEFDRPAQSRILAADRTTGSLKVRFVSSMHNTNFDLLLQEMHFK